MRETTSYAKQLYLYGEGETKAIKDPAKLSKASGSPVNTIRKHIQKWRAEAQELALRSEQSPFSIQLSEEVLTQHKKEIDFLAKQVKGLRIHLRKLDKSTGAYHTMLASYQSALTKWEKSSGILAHYDTAAAAMKESARAHAREKAKLNQGNPGPPPKRRSRSDRFDIE